MTDFLLRHKKNKQTEQKLFDEGTAEPKTSIGNRLYRQGVVLVSSATLIANLILPSYAVAASNNKAEKQLSAEEIAKIQADLLEHNEAFLKNQQTKTSKQVTSPKQAIKDTLANPLDKSSKPQTSDNATLDNKAIKAATKVEKLAGGNMRYQAGQSQGSIGQAQEGGDDTPDDNLFYIDINKIPKGTQIAWLNYQVKGVMDQAGVARSINDEPAQGGELIKNSGQWHIVRQAINPKSLKEGSNVVRFAPSNDSVGYEVRQVSIDITPIDEKKVGRPSLIVNEASHSYDGKVQITGYVADLSGLSDHVMVGGEKVALINDGFSTIVDTAKLATKAKAKPNNKIEIPVSLQITTTKGLELLQIQVKVENKVNADQLVNIDKPGETRYASDNNEPETLHLNGVSIDLTADAKEGRDISVTALRSVDMPTLDNGMVNLTVGADSYRFLPHGTKFSQAQTVRIKYNPKAIPEGFSAHDIQTYYFDENENRWVALDKVEVDEKEHIIVSTTDHFTDMINAVAKSPDMPETSALTPTTFSGMSAADPTAQINLMSAPSANSQGSANISYPLQLPAGRRGLTPSLGLNYNSSAANGVLGMGWDLNLPSVSIDTRWGVPRYDAALETETYIFAGSQLAPVAHRSTPVSRQSERQFYPRVEGSFNKTIRHGSSPKNYWWEVTDKSGTRHLFGGRNDSLAADAVLTTSNGNIGHWALAQTIDPYGNTITYTYDKVAATGVKNSKVAGQALYLKKINYTGKDNQPGVYDVNFEREAGRPDVMIDARLGYKQVIGERIKRISMSYNGEPIRSYALNYKQGAFYKTLLDSVVQYDADGKEFTRHDLSYFDDIGNQPYSGSSNWSIPNDGLNAGLILAPDKATALGGTKSKGSGKHAALTIGFDDKKPMCKSQTVGGNVNSSKSKSEGLVAMTDINGDGLPDKVIQRGDGLAYRPNMSGATMKQTQFGELYSISKVTQFLKEESKTRVKGFEVNPFTDCDDFSISAGINQSKSTSRTNVYFSDVNGDGLTDIVDNGRVYFNRLLDNGNIEMLADSSQTPNRIGQAGSAKVVLADLTPQELAAFNKNNPLQDTVKVWVAPYAGSVQVQAPAQLQAPSEGELPSADGVRLTIEAQNGNQNRIIWQNGLINAGQTVTPALSAIPVNQGDRIYFRVHSNNDGNSDDVLWQPVITYTDKPQSVDANGRLQYQFDAKDDFILSSRQVPKVTLPLNGQVTIKGELSKGLTSDNIRLRIIATNRNGNSRTLYTQNIGAAAGNIAINTSANVALGDTLSFELDADSRIDWTQVNWQPVIQYTNTDNANVNKALAGGQNLEAFTFQAVPSMALYQNVISAAVPRPSRSGQFSIRPNLNLNGTSGKLTLSVKASDGQPGSVAKLLAQKSVQVVNGNLTAPINLTGVAPASNLLYVEVTTDDVALGQALAGSSYTITTNGINEQTLPLSVFAGSDNWLLGSLYRGFGQFVYNGNAPWGDAPIDPSVLVAKKNINQDLGNIDTSSEAGIDAAANSDYNPANARFITMLPDGARRLFVGLDEDNTVTKFGLSSTRLGQKSPVTANLSGTSGSAAVAKISESESTTKRLSGSNGIGAGISLIDSKTRIITDFMDMNGDRYPDVLSEKGIQYTNMLGSLSEQMSRLQDIRVSKSSSKSFNISGGYGDTKEHILFGEKGSTRISVPETQGSAGVTGNVGDGSTKTFIGIVDMNGDGLGDKVYSDGGVALNLGYGFAAVENWGYPNIRTQKTDTQSLGGNINIGAYSLAGGISLDTTNHTETQSLFDINGDGLPDVVTNGLPLMVRLNTGSGFAANQAWPGINTQGDNKVYNESANVAFTACLIVPNIIKTCLNTGGNWNQGLATPEVAIQDINGDGYPDITQSNGDGNLSVATSTIGRTNLLATIKRPMGSVVKLDYARTGNTYAMPQSRWVLNRVEVIDAVAKNGGHKSLNTFIYKSGNYDRREREFYGFKQVITHQYDTITGKRYRTNTQEFNNTDYHLKGLPLQQTLTDASGNTWTKSSNEYVLKQAWGDPDPQSGSFIADTHAAYPALVKTQTAYFEGEAQAQKSKTETFAYDGYGNVTTYQDLGDVIGEGGQSALRADISYHDPSKFTTYISGVPSQIKVTDANGTLRQRSTNVNGQGDIILIEAQTGAGNPAITTIRYNDMGNISALVGASNERGERLGYGYGYDKQTHSRITAIADTYGYSSITRYDHRWGTPTLTTDINGNKTSYSYDSVGRLISVTGPKEAAANLPFTIKMSYSPFSEVPWAKTEHYDAAGKAGGADDTLDTITFTDSLGRVIQTKKDGSIYTAKRQADTPVMIVSGYQQFDGLGRTDKVYYPTTEAKGSNTDYNPQKDGSAPTTSSYDVMDRVVATTLPDGASTRMSYGFANSGSITGFSTQMIDANGVQTQSISDIDGRTVSVTNGLGDTTTYGYDALGQIIQVTDAAGNQTISSYDLMGRRTSIQNPDTGTTVYGYDPAGNLIYEQTAELAPQGLFIRYVYDHTRLIKRTDPTDAKYNSRDVSYAYGKPGSAHNRAGRIVLVQDATGSSEYYYDELGNVSLEVATLVDFNSQTRTYIQETETDTWGRVQHIIYPDGEKVSYRYNAGGKLASMAGRKKGHDYDYIKQLGYDKFEQRVFQWHGNNATTYYDYDSRRRLSRLKVNAYDEYFGSKQTRNLMDNRYDYDNTSNILAIQNTAPLPTRISQLGGNMTQTFAYDDAYQLINAAGDFESKNRRDRYSVNMQYDEIHNITQKVQTHETTGKIINNWREVRGTSYSGQYAYSDKQPHAVSNISDGEGNKQQFIYDENGRHSVSLNENKQGNQTATRKLNWDAHGNLLEIDQNGSKQQYLYDGAGNRRIKNNKIYPFSTLVVSPTGYTKHYFADGQRIASKIGKALETPLFATQPQQQAPAGTSAGDDVAQSVEDLYSHYNTLVQARSNGVLEYKPRKLIVDLPDFSDEDDPRNIDYEPKQYFYHQDHIGSSSYLTDAGGEVHEFYAYFPSGELFVSQAGSFGTDYKFTGKELDTETGLYYFGARYYDPRTQVWQSPDPILSSYLDGKGSQGGVFNPVNLNLYGYVQNNPVNLVDPDGRESTGQWLDRKAQSAADKAVRSGKWGDHAKGFGITVAKTAYDVAGAEELSKAVDGQEYSKVGVALEIAAVIPAGKAGNLGKATATGCSFESGTLVATPDGDKPIEEIEVGDLVLAKNELTGEVSAKPVKHKFINSHDGDVRIVTIKTLTEEQAITTSDDHPFYVKNKGWVEAKTLRYGDVLVSLNDTSVVVVGNQLTDLAIPMYNFEVADYHTYSVTSEQVWVHNVCARLAEHLGDMTTKEADRLVAMWDKSTYDTVTDSILDHAGRKGFGNDVAKYLRKAANFNKRNKNTKSKPLEGGATRWNNSVSGEYLIERNGKIVTYGINKKN